MIYKIRKIKIIALIKFMLKTLVAMFITLVIVAIIEFIYTSTRNYLGYCTWDNQRMGKRYTTEERLDIAINSYLQKQHYLDMMEIDLIENKISRKTNFFEDLDKRFSLIVYDGKEQFIKENPECCERTWGLVEGEQFGFWERADGAGDGMFVFRHKIRYINNEDRIRNENISTKTYYAVNNCGFPTSYSYN